MKLHYTDVIMGAMVSQITSLTIVYSTVYSGADQRKHQSTASLAFVRGIHRWPVNSPHKSPVTRKLFPFDDVIMQARGQISTESSKCEMCLFMCVYFCLWAICLSVLSVCVSVSLRLTSVCVKTVSLKSETESMYGGWWEERSVITVTCCNN